MNTIKVKLPFSDIEIEQLADGHPVTEAADFLQSTIIDKTQENRVKGLELGSGNGIISFMLALQKPDWQLTGIELQKELLDLAQSNNARLGLDCRFISGDLREYKTCLEYRAFDLIYSNPPWIKAGSGKVSPDEGRAMSRQEITCTMKDILACIEWSLNENGVAWLIYPNDRKPELANELMRTELEAAGLFSSEISPHSFVAKLKRKPVSKHW